VAVRRSPLAFDRLYLEKYFVAGRATFNATSLKRAPDPICLYHRSSPLLYDVQKDW
jgi:hypothetical protein